MLARARQGGGEETLGGGRGGMGGKADGPLPGRGMVLSSAVLSHLCHALLPPRDGSSSGRFGTFAELSNSGSLAHEASETP